MKHPTFDGRDLDGMDPNLFWEGRETLNIEQMTWVIVEDAIEDIRSNPEKWRCTLESNGDQVASPGQHLRIQFTLVNLGWRSGWPFCMQRATGNFNGVELSINRGQHERLVQHLTDLFIGDLERKNREDKVTHKLLRDYRGLS